MSVTRSASTGVGAAAALPRATPRGGMPVAEAIARRRSHRSFHDVSLSPEQVAQLCWAAQGVTDPVEGLRAAPSAGALHPMTILVADREGVFEYLPAAHALRTTIEGDVRDALQAAALGQTCVGDAPVTLAIVMRVGRLTRRYGEWSERYCLIEAGHVAQNVLLTAAALGLAGVPVGAFDDGRVARILKLDRRSRPAYLLPLGAPAA